MPQSLQLLQGACLEPGLGLQRKQLAQIKTYRYNLCILPFNVREELFLQKATSLEWRDKFVYALFKLQIRAKEVLLPGITNFTYGFKH